MHVARTEHLVIPFVASERLVKFMEVVPDTMAAVAGTVATDTDTVATFDDDVTVTTDTVATDTDTVVADTGGIATGGIATIVTGVDHIG